MTLGERLAKARDRAGMSQSDLARKAGVSQSTIGNLEAGIRKRPRDLLPIARALHVSPDWLATGAGAMSESIAPPAEWPFELLTREQWMALSERQRGAVEAAALRAAQGLQASEPATDRSRQLALAFEQVPADHRERLFAMMLAALQDPETHIRQMEEFLRAGRPTPALDSRPRKRPA